VSVTLDRDDCSRFCFGMGTMWLSFHDWGEHEAINDNNDIQIKASSKAKLQMANMRLITMIVVIIIIAFQTSLSGRVLNWLSG